MNKTIIIGIILALLIVGVAYADNMTNSTENETDNIEIIEDQDELCNYIIQKANIPIGTKIPGFFIQYKNAKFNVYTKNNETLGHLIISKSYVAEYNCETIEDPDYNVYLKSKETVDQIIDAESRVKALKEKINSNEIIIQGTTTAKRINFFITKIAINIASLFI